MSTSVGPRIDASWVISQLRELDRRTGGASGARRVAWTEPWHEARAFLAELLAEIEIEPEQAEAGNLWAWLKGDGEPALALGSHLDSVPAGGWLDGALGVMAGLGVLRSWAAREEPPPRTLALVDWADEEGARFGHSLFGSSAFAGTLAADDADVVVVEAVLGVLLHAAVVPAMERAAIATPHRFMRVLRTMSMFCDLPSRQPAWLHPSVPCSHDRKRRKPVRNTDAVTCAPSPRVHLPQANRAETPW